VLNTTAAVIIIAAATMASYHRLFLKTPSGQLGYSAVRWGLKTFMYPRLIFNSDAIRSGVWPLWNPYPFGGSPWVSNFQAMLFHPVNLLIILLFGYSAEVIQMQLVFIFFIAGLAMYGCAREFAVRRSAALLAAISFLGCGFFVGNASYFPQVNTLAVAPLVLLFVRRTVRRGGWGPIAAGALSAALMIFSGFPTLAFFLAFFSALFGVMDIWFIQRSGAAAGLRKTLRMAILFALAFGLSACLLLPALESYPLITRPDRAPGSALALPAAVVGEKSLAPANLLSLAFPFLGAWRLADYNLWIEFRNCSIGLVGFFFAAYYFIFRPGRQRWVLLFFFLLALLFSLGMNTPIYKSFYRRFSPFGMVSHPALDFRAIFFLFLCLAAGLGMERFLEKLPGEEGRLRFTILGLVVAGGMLLAAVSRLRGFGVPGVVKGNWLWLASVAALAAVVSWKKLSEKYLAFCLVALALADTAWWVNTNFRTVAEPVSSSHWIKRKGKEAARTRSVTANKDFQRNEQYPSRQGVKSMFWKYFSDSGNDGTRLRSFQAIMNTPARKILTDDFRLIPVYSVRMLNDQTGVIQEIIRGVNLRQVGLISREDIGSGDMREKLEALSSPGGEPDDFQGRVVYCKPDEIRYDLFLERPAVIFFNEIYYPGWKLSRGDESLPLFPLNHAFRGTYLEEGHHNLVMTFSPRSYKIGLALSCLSGLFCLGVMGADYFRKTGGKDRPGFD